MISNIVDRINNSDNILIISHKSPDGDSIGSILGLGISLKKAFDKNINISINDEVPNRFSFLKTEEIGYVDSTEEYDLVFMLDCGDFHRAGIHVDSEKVINIDHHITNPHYGDINFVKSDASSTSEIVYDLLKDMNIELDIDAAEALYTGIVSDTGSFKYSCTSPETHLVASELVSRGIDRDKIINNLFQSKKLTSVLLLKEAIEHMELLDEGKISYLYISEELLKNSGARIREGDVLVEFFRDIQEVEVSVTLKKTDEGYKGSLRSKNEIDVSKIASRYGGGGHRKAAGFLTDLDIDKLKIDLINEIKKELRR